MSDFETARLWHWKRVFCTMDSLHQLIAFGLSKLITISDLTIDRDSFELIFKTDEEEPKKLVYDETIVVTVHKAKLDDRH